MNVWKRVKIAAVTAVLLVAAAEVGEQMSVPGFQSAVPDSEARFGRPLTPVSVAGVARRTVRRCAVGVYRC